MKRLIYILAAVCLLTPSCFAKEEVTINVLPYPQSVEIGKGTFKGAGANINAEQSIDEKSMKLIRSFGNQMTLVSGRVNSFATPVGLTSDSGFAKMKGFIFLNDTSLANEEYGIEINKTHCIVRASSFNGYLYAIQTLKQLTSPSVFGKTPNPDEKFLFPAVKIQDKPRFKYRGMMLDCARHFFQVEEVKRFIDIMATFKLNTLHWHLTDDQGWRAEIKKYPKLTEVGGFRNGTMIDRDWDSNDGIRYGGYYTQEQMKEVVAYAAENGITVIPEVDLPGHMVAALTAYPHLGCTGGPYEVRTIWGISEELLCPGKEDMFTFLEGVFEELFEIFPSEYVHIGGDECPKKEWEKCPACQARIAELGLKDDDHFTAEQYLQSYVTARMQKFINGHGRKMIGWDEILEGELAEGATVMSWRGTAGGIKASEMGYDVIMTPTTYNYFDYCQSKDQASEPVGIGGFLPIEKTYSYEPLEGMSEKQKSHILGVQANLWTEYIATPEHLEYMLLPRMVALSEVQWCKPEDKDFARFSAALEAGAFKIFDVMNYNYRKLTPLSPEEVAEL